MQSRRFVTGALILALCAGSADIATGASLARARGSSPWWSHLDPIDASLHDGQWEVARQNARSLADTVLKQDWDDRELDSILAELAFYQAVANANLDLQDQAIWDWHTALNLDRWIAARDLEPYGEAARLFVDNPLRRLGVMPPGFEQRDPATYRVATVPEAPSIPIPNLLNRSGAASGDTGDFKVELIVDHTGALHQPVVISRHLHPVVVYACLDWLRDLPRFGPSRLKGDPIDTLFPLTLDFMITSHPGGFESARIDQSR